MADEDRQAVDLIIATLRGEGHTVFHAYDVLSATQLVRSIDRIDLLISNTKVAGMEGVQLILELRKERPDLPIVYLANRDRSTPEVERQLPTDVPIVREPFTSEKLVRVVAGMMDGNRPPGGEFTG